MNNDYYKNDRDLILKSLCHIEVILNYTSDILGYESFIKAPTALDVTLFHLGQIGELCKRYTDNFKSSHKSIDFRAIAGLRNIVIHDYSGVDYNEIYDIVKKDLFILKEQYNNILLNEYSMSNVDIENIINNYIETRIFVIEDGE